MKKFCLKHGPILLLFGAILLFVLRNYIIIAFSDPVDVFAGEVNNASEIKAGMAIDTDVSILLDCFATKETKSKRGSTTGKNYYYIMPVYVGEEVYYVAFDGGDEKADLVTYDRMVDETLNYFTMRGDTLGTYSVRRSGGLTKLEKEVYGYMVDWFENNEWFENDADIDKYVLPLVFEKVSNKSTKNMFYIFAGATVLGLIMTIIGVSSKFSKKNEDVVQ